MVEIKSAKVRLALFAFIGAGSFVIGHWFVTDQAAAYLVKNFSYWTLLVTFLWYCGRLIQILMGKLRANSLLGLLLKINWVASAAVMLGTMVLQVHDERGFKVIEDEVVLASLSHQMHFAREAAVPGRGHSILGVYKTFDSHIDKRQLLYPFLVSVLHDVTGYRPANGFWLNLILTPLLLALLYMLGRKIGGNACGLTAILLAVSTPVLAPASIGGGAELLNLVLLVASLLFSIRLLQNPNREALSILCLSGVLLAHTRHESPIYLIAIGLIIILAWWRGNRVLTSPALFLSPILLMPYLWIGKVFAANPQFWQLDSEAGITRPFGSEFVTENFSRLMEHFFDHTINQPNNLLLATLGLICLIGFGLSFLRKLTNLKQTDALQTVLGVYLAPMAIYLGLLLFYAHSSIYKPTADRLLIPLYLPLLYCSLLVFFNKGASRWLHGGFIALALVHFITVVPSLSRHVYSDRYTSAREVAWARDFIADNKGRDYLMIATYHILWIVHNEESISMKRAYLRKAQLDLQMRLQPKKELLVFQSMGYNPLTGEEKVLDQIPLGDEFILEPLERKFLTIFDYVQISRIKSIRLQPGEKIQLPEFKAGAPGEVESTFRFWLEICLEAEEF